MTEVAFVASDAPRTKAAWFGDTFRKVHTLYVSPPWARERGARFDADETAARLEAADVECVELYCKDHHGVCYYPCSLGLPYPRDVVGELCAAVNARGMRFIAYFSVGFDSYALGVHPEWRATDRDGEPRRQPPFFWACLGSPYRDYALTQLDELIGTYPIDGLWLDIVPFAWDTPQALWMQTVLPVPCYCHACQARFEEATGHPLPRDTDDLSPVLRRTAHDFLLADVRSFVEAARDRLRAARPDAILTYNGANGPGDPLRLGDLVSIEGHAPNYERQSLIGAWARGLGRPFEILAAGGLPGSFTGWNGFDQKPPAVLRVEAAIAAAHGGSAVIGHTPYPNGETAPGQFAGFAAAFRPLRALEEAGLTHPHSMTEVAIGLATKPDTSPESWTDALAGAEAVNRALLNAHIPADLLPRLDLDDLSRYRLVILADQATLDAAEIEPVRAFVAGGGALLAIGATAIGDDGIGGAFDDVLGIERLGPAGWPFAYVTLDDAALADGVSAVPLLVNGAAFRIGLNGARPLASLVPPETGRTDATTVLWGNPPPAFERAMPGISMHDYGAGRALYVACSLAANRTDQVAVWDTRGLEDAWLQRLIQNAVRFLLPTPLLRTNAPAGVHLVFNRHRERLALHLIDTRPAAPEHIRFGPESATDEWTVWFDRQRVGNITTMRMLGSQSPTWRTTDVAYVVRMPPIDDHAVLVIELDA